MTVAVFAADEQNDRPVETLRWVTLAEAVLEARASVPPEGGDAVLAIAATLDVDDETIRTNACELAVRARAILDGVDDQDADLCKMPHFRAKFVDAGVDPTTAAGQIVQFLRSLRPTEHMVPDSICPVPDAAPADAGAAGG